MAKPEHKAKPQEQEQESQQDPQQAMQTPNPDEVAKAESIGMDWGTWLLLYQAIVQYGPEAVSLIRKLVDFFNRQPVFGSHHEDEVKKLACKNLTDALQAACSSACLHEEICGHEGHDHE